MPSILEKATTILARKAAQLRHRYLDDFVFIHINKTGGSSIEKALNLPFEHKTAIEKIDEIGRRQWDRRYSFTAVRNPWDKVVSHYHYRVQTNQTDLAIETVDFKKWVQLTYGSMDPIYYDKPKMFMPQSDWIVDRDGKVVVNFICRFENLSNDFRQVCSKLGKAAQLPHLKASKRGHYSLYYDDATEEIVGTWFAKDLENFGYQFEKHS